MSWIDRLLYKAPSPVVMPPVTKKFNADGWQNAYTGFGTSRDRAMFSAYQMDAPLSSVDLDAMFYGSDIAAKIVETKPKEMFRRGYELVLAEEEEDEDADAVDVATEALDEEQEDAPLPKVAPPKADAFPVKANPQDPNAPDEEEEATPAAAPLKTENKPKLPKPPTVPLKPQAPGKPKKKPEASTLSDDLMDAAREMDADQKLLEGFTWGQLYGGALAILGANDGQEIDQPLNEKKVRSFDFIHVVDRRYAQAFKYYEDPRHPKFGMPELYQVGEPNFGQWAVVHESRCLRFGGVRVDARRRRSNAGWDNSVLQRPYESIRDFSAAFQAVGYMMADASQGVFKLSGLVQAIASGEKDAIQARMALVDMTRGVARSVLLDAEAGESFEKIPTAFGGIADLLDRYMLRLAAAADMPVTILMGRSPAGMNATGESDFRAFYAAIESEQKNVLKPILMRLYTLIAASMGHKDVEGLDFKFHPLWSPTDAEQAALELVVAQKDVAYMTAGVLHPSEVALSRYGAGMFSMATEIDTDSRKAEMKADIEAALNPPPEPTMAAVGVDPATGEPVMAPNPDLAEAPKGATLPKPGSLPLKKDEGANQYGPYDSNPGGSTASSASKHAEKTSAQAHKTNSPEDRQKAITAERAASQAHQKASIASRKAGDTEKAEDHAKAAHMHQKAADYHDQQLNDPD